MVMLLLTALLVGAFTVGTSHPINSPAMAVNYLAYFGYMQHQTSTNGSINTEADMRTAILNFQYMANLTETGILDNATMTKMNEPRCGMPDVIGNSIAARKKRYSLGSRWSRNDLTFRIDNVTPDISDPADVFRTLEAALKVWSDVTPLTFTRVASSAPADIIISFSAGAHGDGNPFDGPSQVLAHAYFPENGDAHFDEDERWSLTSNGINLFIVAAHEFGHSLGLGHSNTDTALMAPFYRYVEDFTLHEDDLAGIQAHYGPNVGRPDVTMAPNPVTMPPDEGCTGVVDAVTTTRDRSTYIFEGSLVWKFTLNSYNIEAGYPKSIASTFVGLPNNVDAALHYGPNRKTYIFKGSQYWRFDNEVMDSGYPRSISSTFIGIPDDIDAAFVWGRNGRIYFFKGNEYYRFSGRIDTRYPRPASVWRIPGANEAAVGAVAQWTNGRTYFFTNDGQYYRFDDSNFQIDNNYPRDTATLWQGCTNLRQAGGGSTVFPELNDVDNGSASLLPSILTAVMFVFIRIIM